MNSTTPRLPRRVVVLLAQAFVGWLERLRRAILPPEIYLMDSTVLGAVRAHAVYTGVRLGLFEALATGARTSAEVAAAIGGDPVLTWRLLRALASFGIVDARGDGYAINAVSRLLLPGTGYHEGMLFNADPRQLGVWGLLADSIRGSRSAFELASGVPFFEQLGRDRALGALFDQAMHAWAAPTIAAVVQTWRPPSRATIVDVGGGHGHYLAAVLAKSPDCRGVLFDRPEVLAGAGPTLAPVADRVTTIGGSFFESVPAEGDIYLLANILHDWSDQECVRILQRVRAVLRPESRVHVIELIVPEGSPAHPGPLVDLMMMALFRDGRERTEAEFRALARAAGLDVERVIPTITPSAVVVMRPAAR